MIESISAEDDRSLAPPAGHAGQQAVVKSATFVEVATKLPAVGNVATNVPQLSWPGLAHGCPARILLCEAHDIDSTRVWTLATLPDTKRAMPCRTRIA